MLAFAFVCLRSATFTSPHFTTTAMASFLRIPPSELLINLQSSGHLNSRRPGSLGRLTMVSRPDSVTRPREDSAVPDTAAATPTCQLGRHAGGAVWGGPWNAPPSACQGKGGHGIRNKATSRAHTALA